MTRYDKPSYDYDEEANILGSQGVNGHSNSVTKVETMVMISTKGIGKLAMVIGIIEWEHMQHP